jgi:hypothetical protein
MLSGREVRAEIAVTVTAIAGAAFFFVEGRTLKPGVFEPIGPGAVPMGVAVLTIVLALAVMAERVLRAPAPARNYDEAASTSPPAAIERWPVMLGIAAITAAYVSGMHLGLVGYRIATVAYLAAAVLLAAEDRVKALPWAIGLGAAFGLGLDHVFRSILVTDLP